MQDILFSLLAWIGTQTGYDVRLELPNLVLTTAHNMCAQYGIHHKTQCDHAGLKGFYDKDLTIFLGTDFDPADMTDQSRLVHELVHYVQWQNDKQQATCLGHLEVEAYDLQDTWRAVRGLPPALDPFNRILLGASCES